MVTKHDLENPHEVFDALQRQVVWLHVRWCMYKKLFPDSKATMQLLRASAPWFFLHVEDMLSDTILLQFSRLTDPPRTKGKNNLSLLRLEEDHIIQKLDSEVAEQIKEAIKDLVAYCKPIRDRRNKLLAHNDLPCSLNKVPWPGGVSRELIDKALQKVWDVMDMVERFLKDEETSFQYYRDGRDDGGVEELLILLEKARKYKE